MVSGNYDLRGSLEVLCLFNQIFHTLLDLISTVIAYLYIVRDMLQLRLVFFVQSPHLTHRLALETGCNIPNFISHRCNNLSIIVIVIPYS
jgi:hypothetical protein